VAQNFKRNKKQVAEAKKKKRLQKAEKRLQKNGPPVSEVPAASEVPAENQPA